MDPLLLVAMPLLAAFLLPVVAQHSTLAARLLGPLVLLANLALSVHLWGKVGAVGPLNIALGGFPAPLGIVFHVDQLALLFTGLVSLATLVLWPNASTERSREAALALLLVAGGCGLALSGDLFNIYVFYEVIAVASYGLAASSGTPAAYAATLRFLVLSALGSALALLGIALVYATAGTLNLAHLAQLAPTTLAGPVGLGAFVLMLIGFGVKAELFPVNTWVPEVYASAPSRVAALLGGVVSKLALLVVLRLMVLLFAETSAPQLLLILGVLGVASGELAAYRALDLRRVLGYSSIGQLGLAAVALAVPGPAGVLAALALALHHLLVKPALFLLTDAWGGPLDRIDGAAARSPVAALLFVLLALSLIGVPPLPGFWAKFLLLQSLLASGTLLQALAAAVVLAATVIEAAYLFTIVRRLYREETPQAAAPSGTNLVLASALGAALLVATVTVTPLGAAIGRIAQQTSDVPGYIQSVLGP